MALGVALFLVAAMARADLHMVAKRESGSDQVTLSGTVSIWMLKDRVRHEINNQPDLILRLDEQKLYLFDSREHSYTVVDLRQEGDGWVLKSSTANPPSARMTAKMEPTGKTRQIGPWKAQQQRVTLIQSPPNVVSRTDWWIAPELHLEYGALRALLRLEATFSPTGDSWVETLLANGYPVFWERVEHPARFPTMWQLFAREELQSVEENQAPAHIYEPPSDYKQVDFHTYRQTHRLPAPFCSEILP
jgi:hypothetical protein